jgi:hypothetical protein
VLLIDTGNSTVAGPAYPPPAPIGAKPNFGVARVSKAHTTAVATAQDNDRLDPQEQARQFILAKPSFNGPAGGDRLRLSLLPS